MGGSKADWRQRCFHLLDRIDLYKFIFNEMGEMVVYWYPDGRFGCVNDKYRETSGLGEGDTPEGTVYDCIVPEDRDGFRAVVAGLSKSSPVATGEMRVRHSSGGVRWHRWTHRACFDAQGLAGYFSVGQDMTPQKVKARKLAETESLLGSILDSSEEAIYVKDLEGRYRYVNRHYASMLNKRPEDMVGHLEAEYFPRHIWEAFAKNDRKVVECGTSMRFEEVNTLMGKEMTFVSSKFPVRDNEGKTVAIGGITVDISERKRTEALVGQIASAGSPLGRRNFLDELLVACANAVRAQWLSIAERGPGGTLHPLGAVSDGKIEMPSEHDVNQAPLTCAMEEEFFVECELRTRFPDSDLVRRLGAAGFVGVPVYLNGRNPAGVLGAFFLTELRQPDLCAKLLRIFAARAGAEIRNTRTSERLRHALAQAHSLRDLSEAVFQSLKDGLVVIDPRGKILSINPMAEDWFGVDSPAVRGRDLREVKGLMEKLAGFIGVPGEDEGQGLLELPASKKRGHRCISVERVPLLNRKGKTFGATLVLHDVTREIALDRLKSEFISTAAHELKTPLTAVAGFAEILLEGVPCDREDCLRSIHQAALQVNDIVDEMLDLSRIESGRLIQISPAPMDLAEVVRKEAGNAPVTYRKHVFDIEIADEPLPVLGDAGKIAEALCNIIGNAVKFSPEGSTVRVRCRSGAGVAVVSVGDTGRGMNEEQVRRAVEKFFRVDSSDTAPPGLGLGLTLTKAIMDAHQGGLHIDSAPGAGTTVYLELPLFPERDHDLRDKDKQREAIS